MESAVDSFMLRDARIHLQSKAARGLALIGAPESVKFLDEGLRSPQWETQLVAAVGLAYRKDSRVFDVLIKALSDKTTAIQLEAVEGLAYLKDSRAIPFLKEVASKRDIPIRVIEAAKQAIEQIAEGAALD
jgi:HEAT repeat protein